MHGKSPILLGLILSSALFPEDIAAQCEVTTFAGSGVAGSADGTGAEAQFNFPNHLAIDSDGNLYVTDAGGHLIRKITPAAEVTTLAGSGVAGFANGTGAEAEFNLPSDVAIDSAGNVYVADFNNRLIRKITPAGEVTTFAGSGAFGFVDGTGAEAQFRDPAGLAIDSTGNLYVADSNNNVVRKITPAAEVTTFAGSGIAGFADGTGVQARFQFPVDVAIDSVGNIYVADDLNHAIRKITPAGEVTTFAGTGIAGFADGTGAQARFGRPSGVGTDSAGNVYVADTLNNRIRKITPAGVVSTLAGTGIGGFADGTIEEALFSNPQGVATDGSGDVYVADTLNNRIRRITGCVVDPPVLTSVTPGSAAPDQKITLAGSGFSDTTHVTVGGETAAFQVIDDSIIIVTVPNLPVGTLADVVVTSPGGSATLQNSVQIARITIATLGQAFAGPLGSDIAFTTVEITNRDQNQTSCEVELSFDQGSQAAPPVAINGALVPDNTVIGTIPPGGAQSFKLTSDELAIGIVKVKTESPCDSSSLSTSGSYTLSNGSITEVFSIAANTSETWLKDGQCRVFTAFLGTDTEGFVRNTGMATASVLGEAAPEGTQLVLETFNAAGAPVVIQGFDPRTPITGIHTPVFPFDPPALGLNGLCTIVACLDVPSEGNGFTLDMTLVGVKQKGGVQYESEIFVDGFESGDTSAWTNREP